GGVGGPGQLADHAVAALRVGGAVRDEDGAVPVGEAASGVADGGRIIVEVVVAVVRPGGGAEEVTVVRQETVGVPRRAVVVAVELVVAVGGALRLVVGPELGLVVAALRGRPP